MEKPSPIPSGEQDFNKININATKNEPNTKILFSIKVPDLILRDSLRILKSNYIKID
jgi:hypothetical protein